MTLQQALITGSFEEYRSEFARRREADGRTGTDYRLAESLFHQLRFRNAQVLGMQQTYGTVAQDALPGTEAENGGE